LGADLNKGESRNFLARHVCFASARSATAFSKTSAIALAAASTLSSPPSPYHRSLPRTDGRSVSRAKTRGGAQSLARTMQLDI
jgi:hypothetical protein